MAIVASNLKHRRATKNKVTTTIATNNLLPCVPDVACNGCCNMHNVNLHFTTWQPCPSDAAAQKP